MRLLRTTGGRSPEELGIKVAQRIPVVTEPNDGTKGAPPHEASYKACLPTPIPASLSIAVSRVTPLTASRHCHPPAAMPCGATCHHPGLARHVRAFGAREAEEEALARCSGRRRRRRVGQLFVERRGDGVRGQTTRSRPRSSRSRGR